MRRQLLDDLIAHLSADPGTPEWYAERDRLRAEVQTLRDAIPTYQSTILYRLEHRVRIGDRKQYHDVGTATPDVGKARAVVRAALAEYPLEELFLYYGQRRIRNIEAWSQEDAQV